MAALNKKHEQLNSDQQVGLHQNLASLGTHMAVPSTGVSHQGQLQPPQMSTPPPAMPTSMAAQTSMGQFSQSHATAVSQAPGIMTAGGKPITPSSTPPTSTTQSMDIKPDLSNPNIKVEVKEEVVDDFDNIVDSSLQVAKKEPREYEEVKEEVKTEVKTEHHSMIASKEEPGGPASNMSDSKANVDQKPVAMDTTDSSSNASSTSTPAANATTPDGKVIPRNKKSEFLLYFVTVLWYIGL